MKPDTIPLLAGRSAGPIRPAATGIDGCTPEAFRDGFGEDLASVMNLDSWRAGQNLDAEYRRVEDEVAEAVSLEGEAELRIREEVHPKLAFIDGAPKNAGVHKTTIDELKAIHRGLLFRGAVEACDGTSQCHDTIPLTIHQIGVSLVSYQGDGGGWATRLFRRDLRRTHEDPVNEVLDLLTRRQYRGAQNHDSSGDPLSQLARRGVMTYAERAVLAYKSTAPWRMGHGNPAAHELLMGGAGSADLMIESVKAIRQLAEGHRKFVFVSSEPADRVLLTIGHSLRPLEYAIVDTLRDRLAEFIDNARFHPAVTVDNRWDGVPLATDQWLVRFRDQVAARVVCGVYRASPFAPAQVFYAHEDHAAIAVRIAMADSILQEHRGFPTLIDLADEACRSLYGGATLGDLADAAYARAGAATRYASERMSRDRR
ncbi:hypothetical protein [Zavarzinella formosa]|uniref:hypothetical protein n=1 Tax=Zavarzinella formosa TaxID=360055 RepID=UPI0002FE4F7C|nr:hypothetical protein [Zavarzinella formosa]